jgi:hypothetical protein
MGMTALVIVLPSGSRVADVHANKDS